MALVVPAYSVAPGEPRSSGSPPPAASAMTLAKMKSAFEAAHKSRFGFIDESKELVVEAVSVEAIGGGTRFTPPGPPPPRDPLAPPPRRTRFFSRGQWHDATVYTRAQLSPGQSVDGPAI